MKNNLYIQPLSSLDKKEYIILNLKSFIFAYSKAVVGVGE